MACAFTVTSRVFCYWLPPASGKQITQEIYTIKLKQQKLRSSDTFTKGASNIKQAIKFKLQQA
jgi:hypothetical protein